MSAVAFRQTLAQRQQRLGAVVLAGGLARRMQGQDKGLLELAGRPMVEYAVQLLRDQVDALVINANRNQQEYGSFGVAVIADRHAGHLGPLAGLSTCIAALGCDYIFMCPCDSPLLEAGLLHALASASIENDADIAVAHDGERLQPVFCVVQARVQASLLAFLEAGERKIDKWFATQNTIEVDCSAFAASFRNINTEEERRQAELEMYR